jgi:hypothetical protein
VLFTDAGALWKLAFCPCEAVSPKRKVAAQIAARATMCLVNRCK